MATPARGGSACSFTPSRVSSEKPAHQCSGPFLRGVYVTHSKRARSLAGKMTAACKLPVSLQVVLRSLIEEALRREDHPGLLANIERQAQAVHQRRRMARAVDGTGRRAEQSLRALRTKGRL